MKALFGVLALVLCLNSNLVKADNPISSSVDITEDHLKGLTCIFAGGATDPECLVLAAVTTVEVSITASIVLLKEMKEVTPDALLYTSGAEASPALESVVEKFQAKALEQGHVISFEETVATIIALN